MAIQNKTTLKGYFEIGDTPTQAQFADLVDSLLSIEGGDVGLTAISALGGTSKVVVIDAGDHNVYYTTVADILAYLNAHDTTDNLAEGSTNLYFTNARGRAVLSAGTGLSYSSSTGVFTLSATTDNVNEGSTNKYYTDTRSRNALATGTGLSYNSSTGVFSINTTTDGISEGTTNKYYTDARARAVISKTGNELSYNNSTGVISKNKTEQTLTDASTITFDVSSGYNAKVTLGGNHTLSFSNTGAGEYYTLKVIQDSTGGRTLTLPGTCKVVNSGGGVVTLTATASATDILVFYYDGANYWVTFGLNYN